VSVIMVSLGRGVKGGVAIQLVSTNFITVVGGPELSEGRHSL
jgi:hypothetical protein